MATPGRYDIRFTRGDRLYKRFTFRDAGVLRDLTGSAAKLQVRAGGDESSALVADLTTNVTLGGTAGTVTVVVEGPSTLAFPAGRYWWSLVLIDSLGKPQTWLAGSFAVNPRVTLQA